MSVNHILFDMKKWYNVVPNGNRLSFNGKNYQALPTSLELSDGDVVELLSSNGGAGGSGPVSGNTQLKCVGMINGQYIGSGQVTVTGIGTVSFDMILSSAFVPKWGGKALLSHVWQRIRHAFITRKVVSA